MIKIERLTQYDEEIAADIGKLLLDLSSSATGLPVARDWLEHIMSSPFHDQFAAFDGNKLVGIATVSIVMGSKTGRNVCRPFFFWSHGKSAALADCK